MIFTTVSFVVTASYSSSEDGTFFPLQRTSAAFLPSPPVFKMGTGFSCILVSILTGFLQRCIRLGEYETICRASSPSLQNAYLGRDLFGLTLELKKRSAGAVFAIYAVR
jgi:hypothetical protein